MAQRVGLVVLVDQARLVAPVVLVAPALQEQLHMAEGSLGTVQLVWCKDLRTRA